MLLTDAIERLAAFEPVPFPVLSLYLDLRPDQTGRDRYDVFVRKTLRDAQATYRPHTPEAESVAADVERIGQYLEREVQPSLNGLAVFACAGADGFFETVPLDVPIEEHRLYIDDQPHVYPLARLDDQYPRYAAVVADTRQARIFVFGTGRRLRAEEVTSPAVRRVKVGGWSQARYQRRAENAAAQHVRELVSVLDRIVTAEQIPSIVLAGDEVVVPLVRAELSPALAERLVDVVALDIRAPERQVLEETLAALRRRDAETDREAVDQLFAAARSAGLGVLGAADVLAALELGQVEELLITARPEILANVEQLVPESEAPPPTHTGDVAEGLAAVDAAAAAGGTGSPGRTVPDEEKVADQLVTLARQTAARIRFIEDPALLAEVGGVGALLRFRI
jgi:peptide subunit release factor 1 (eRF1)